MKHFSLFILSTIVLLASCDDTTDKLGSSLTDVADNIEFFTGEFNVETETMQADSICARSAYGYLGKIQDPETGSFITSNFMTQLRLQPYYTPYYGIDSLIVLDGKDTLDYAKEISSKVRNEKLSKLQADSCFLTLYLSKYIGDSITQMKVVAHEMKKPYSEDEEYSISYDPKKYDYIRTDAGSIHAQRSYSIISNSSEAGNGKSRYISIPLNEPYTNKIRADKDSTFNNFGSYLMYQYYNEDAIYHKGFQNPYNFMKFLVPGFYMEHISGKGVMSAIVSTSLTTYYQVRLIDQKKTAIATCAFSGTEESIQHSTITENDFLSKLSPEEKEKYTFIKSPAGLYTTMKIDVEGIMKGYEEDTLSTVRIFLPCVNNTSDSKYVQNAPSNVMMIQKDSIYTFFDNKKISDYRTTFLAPYSSSTNGYTFGNISTLVNDMYRKLKESGLSADEYAKIPGNENWNVVAIVPIETSYSTIGSASVLTKISHSMALESTKLIRGTKDNGKVKMSVIYSRYRK